MKIYIAAKYAKRFELRELFLAVENLGHTCTSRWIWGDEEGKTTEGAAVMDVEDVLRSDCLVFIGEPRSSKNYGGGRWFEFGLAYGHKKRCICVLDMSVVDGNHLLPAGHESVFTALPDVERVTNFDQLLDLLEVK